MSETNINVDCEARGEPIEISHEHNAVYPIACVLCGTQENVLIFPHRRGKKVVGMIYVCNPHAAAVAGMDCQILLRR